MDYKEFSSKIKEKHPDYAGVDDRVLAEKMIEKYPDYKDSVTFESAQETPVQAQEAPSQTLMGKMGQVAKSAVRTAIGDVSQMAKPLQGPIDSGVENTAQSALRAAGDTMSMMGPSRVSATISQPGQMAGDKVDQALQSRGVSKWVSKPAGMVTSAALDPQSFVMGPVGKTGANLLESSAETLGKKVLAPAASAATAVPTREIIKLAQKPIEILFEQSKKEIGAKLNDVYKAFKFTDGEIRMIAKAENRSGGGSQAVWDDVMSKLEKGEEVTTGELVAARRASSKLGASTKDGMLATQFKKDTQTLESALRERTPELAERYLAHLQQYARAKTREEFLSVLPRNKNGSPNVLRTFGAGAAAMTHPLAAMAMSPITAGLGTLAARGVYEVGKRAINNPVTTIAAPSLLSQLARRKQQQ